MQQQSLVTKVKKLSEKAVLPSRAHETDSGWDLTIIGIEKIVQDTIFFKTGLAIQAPKDHYYEIHIRSSCSSLPIMLANSVGVIDNQYTGELIVGIMVFHPNIGAGEDRGTYPAGMIRILDARPTSVNEVANLILNKKPKLAQLILKKNINTSMIEVVSLDETERGSGGFGSTDKLK